MAGPQVPSGAHSDVALEVAQRLFGLDTEQAVHAAAVEAHVEQALLEGGDVVAGYQPGRHVGQDPVAESPARLVERVEVCGPTTPSTVMPRCCWNSRTARSVASSNSADADPRVGRGWLEQAEVGELAPHLGNRGPASPRR